MQLPNSNGLPVNLLAASFNNTSATYKYYWLLSILQSVENGNLKISKKELFARMISNAWFTVNYFHVSFGKQDLIQDTVRGINRIEKISIDEKRESVFQKLLTTKKPETHKQLWHFNKNVPHWFLSSWFQKMNRTEIYKASQTFKENCLYALHDDGIAINPEWENYLTSNASIIKDFCYWNLTLYLQSRNPSVPDIPNKLIKQANRKALNTNKKDYWKNVFKKEKYITCIFTGEKLTYEERNFQIDHFVPFGFVSHDLIWNLIPIEKKYNPFKSDKLPSIEKHFDKFFDLQKKAFEINISIPNQSKQMEEFLPIFPDLNKGIQRDILQNVIQPLITIASNNGFEFMK